MPTVRAGTTWPDRGEFAVDFHDTVIDTAGFAGLLARRRAARMGGRTVHFLNVPGDLITYATSHGRTDDMPMRAAVGPRLAAEQQDLWSGS
jgi:ABC-type transporter Mla MlaB component